MTRSATFSKGIVINGDNPNVTVDGGLISYPDGRRGAEVGPFGVNSTGTNTVIRNLTVTGKPANSWEANIYVRNGVVSGCTAKRIRVDSQAVTLFLSMPIRRSKAMTSRRPFGAKCELGRFKPTLKRSLAVSGDRIGHRLRSRSC